MKTLNAIKRLNRRGFSVLQEPCRITAEKDGYRRIIELHCNAGADFVGAIKVRSRNDRDDPLSDYIAGSYFPSLAKAIQFAESE